MSLLDYMEELSEWHWNAGWMNNLENYLLRDLQSFKPEYLTADQTEKLQNAVNAAGGMWVWEDAITKRKFEVRGMPLRFVEGLGVNT